MYINCSTLFDCTYTGVTGNPRLAQLPFWDRAQQHVNTVQDWHRSRNQQRNYETLLQIFGLRTQPLNITPPVCKNHIWNFKFEIEHAGVFDVYGNSDVLAGLKQDCDGVPMLINLCEKQITVPRICVEGQDQNVWFEAINI